MNFFAQLRQRRIVQIIVSYLAVGWALLEVADQLADRGVIPNIFYTVILVWVFFGILAAGLIGWHHGEKGKQEAPRSEIIALFVLAILALGSSGFVVRKDMTQRRFKNAAEHPLELQKVAVMYFKDYTDDPDLAYVSDGLTEDLVRSLGSVSELDVLSKNATAQFRGQDPPLDSVAQVLDVGTVVDGSVEKRGPDIEVTLRLVDGKSGAVVQRTKIKMPSTDVLAVRDSVVEQSANWLREWIGKEVRLRSSERGTDVREAWALVQRAENARKAAEAEVHEKGPAAGDAKFAEATADLQQAQKLDPKWTEPLIQQAAITYRRSRLAVAGGAADQAVKLIEDGLKQSEAILALSRNEPRGLELRGTLQYLKWLLNVTPDAAERSKLFASAESDLQQAVQLDPSLASAHSTLSHLLYNKDLSSALIEARLAYEKDAYLEVASDVVWRLFYGHFDQGSLTQSREWCDKGAARFKDDYRFRFCQLRLMASPAISAEPSKAWALAAQIDSLVPEPKKPLEHIRAQMSVAGVLGRAGMRDSADKVMSRAHSAVNLDIDPTYDLISYEATMRILYGEKEEAFTLLRQVTLANPDQGFKKGEPLQWMWRDLQNHPRLNELYAPE